MSVNVKKRILYRFTVIFFRLHAFNVSTRVLYIMTVYVQSQLILRTAAMDYKLRLPEYMCISSEVIISHVVLIRM